MSENEKLVERLGALATRLQYDGTGFYGVETIAPIQEAAQALTLAQARIKMLEEAIWQAHDQLNTYRSAAVEEVIDKLETYIPGLSGQALKEDQR